MDAHTMVVTRVEAREGGAAGCVGKAEALLETPRSARAEWPNLSGGPCVTLGRETSSG